MATPVSQNQRGGEAAMWAVVLSAAAIVVGLALFKERRSAPSSPPRAPAVSLELLEGGRSVPFPKGKVTLVDFWATWCAPCRASMPRVQRLWQDYSSRGMELYSVNTDDESPQRKPAVERFLQQNGLSFPVVLDDGDKTASDAFRIASLPTLIVVDRQGRVVWSRIGALTASEEREVRSVLDGALAGAPAGGPASRTN
jgi:thiol-disulfide isomerase/thioredoxin